MAWLALGTAAEVTFLLAKWHWSECVTVHPTADPKKSRGSLLSSLPSPTPYSTQMVTRDGTVYYNYSIIGSFTVKVKVVAGWEQVTPDAGKGILQKTGDFSASLKLQGESRGVGVGWVFGSSRSPGYHSFQGWSTHRSEWLAQPLFSSLGSPVRVCHCPLLRGPWRPRRRLGAPSGRAQTLCRDRVHPHHSLFPATLSCREWDGPSRLHREGASRPAAPGFVKTGHWGSCSRFLSHANRMLVPCPTHSPDGGEGGGYPKPAPGPAYQSPSGFPQRSQSKQLQHLLLMGKQDSGCDLWPALPGGQVDRVVVAQPRNPGNPETAVVSHQV